jgi:hypothetical protein
VSESWVTLQNGMPGRSHHEESYFIDTEGWILGDILSWVGGILELGAQCLGMRKREDGEGIVGLRVNMRRAGLEGTFLPLCRVANQTHIQGKCERVEGVGVREENRAFPRLVVA